MPPKPPATTTKPEPSDPESVALSNPGASTAEVAALANLGPGPDDVDARGLPTEAQAAKPGMGPNSMPNGSGNPVTPAAVVAAGTNAEHAAANADLAAAAKATKGAAPAVAGLAAPSAVLPVDADGNVEINAPYLGARIMVSAQHPTRGMQTFPATVTMTTPGTARVNALPHLDGSNQEGHGHQFSIDFSHEPVPGKATWSWPAKPPATKIKVPAPAKR